MADISLTDQETKQHMKGNSSDSEDSNCPMDETPDTSISPEPTAMGTSEGITANSEAPEGSALPQEEANKDQPLAEQPEKQPDQQSVAQEPDTKTQHDDTPVVSSNQSDSGKGEEDQTGNQKKSKTKDNNVKKNKANSTQQATLDQNANVDQNVDAKSDSEKLSNKSDTQNLNQDEIKSPQMVFGPQKKPEVTRGLKLYHFSSEAKIYIMLKKKSMHLLCVHV